MTYDALLFDVGGTLLHIVRNPRQSALDAIAHLGTVSLEAFEAAIDRVIEEWRADDGRPEVEDLPGTWESHNHRALTRAGFEGDVAAAARIMEDVFLLDDWEVYADAAPVLRALRASGHRMGVVSNWPATLVPTLRRADLLQHFEVVVASADVGYAKPHARIFEIAASRLAVDPTRMLYVGDSMEHDVRGASAAGMDVVLLDRHDRHAGHPRRVSSLHELLVILGATSGSLSRQ